MNWPIILHCIDEEPAGAWNRESIKELAAPGQDPAELKGHSADR